MASAKTQPARGMRDFLPADVRRREYVIGIVKQVYERYGFEPLETPAVENIETLLGKYGEEGNQLIFKILKRGVHESTGEADLALRYDLTVPLARVFAQYQNNFPRFLKRYQIQPVWRADRPGRGRFREFYQCDVDVVGSRSMVVEAELIAAAGDALASLGFSDFAIRINHREVLTGLLACAAVPLENHEVALIALDKLDKIGREGVAAELNERGIGTECSTPLLDLFSDLNSLDRAADIVSAETNTRKQDAVNAAILGRLVEFLRSNEKGAHGIDELRRILQFVSIGNVPGRIKIDPSLARGLSYYTGAIMEINVADLAGSLGGGGRYDNLIGMFCNKQVPACGFSLGLERIIVVMTERGMFPKNISSDSIDVIIVMAGEELAPIGLSIAADLRTRDPKRSVLVYPQPSDKLNKQRAYGRAREAALEIVIDEQLIWVAGEQSNQHQAAEVALQMLSRIDQIRAAEGAVTRKLFEDQSNDPEPE